MRNDCRVPIEVEKLSESYSYVIRHLNTHHFLYPHTNRFAGWVRLFLDPEAGQYWEEWHPELTKYGMGPAIFIPLSADDVTRHYPIVPPGSRTILPVAARSASDPETFKIGRHMLACHVIRQGMEDQDADSEYIDPQDHTRWQLIHPGTDEGLKPVVLPQERIEPTIESEGLPASSDIAQGHGEEGDRKVNYNPYDLIAKDDNDDARIACHLLDKHLVDQSASRGNGWRLYYDPIWQQYWEAGYVDARSNQDKRSLLRLADSDVVQLYGIHPSPRTDLVLITGVDREELRPHDQITKIIEHLKEMHLIDTGITHESTHLYADPVHTRFYEIADKWVPTEDQVDRADPWKRRGPLVLTEVSYADIIQKYRCIPEVRIGPETH